MKTSPNCDYWHIQLICSIQSPIPYDKKFTALLLLRKSFCLMEAPRIAFYFQGWELSSGFLGVTTPIPFALASDFNYRCATRITIQAFCFVIITARGGWILRQCWTNSFLPHQSQDLYYFQGMMLQMEWQLHCLPFIKHPALTYTLL